MNAKPLKLSSRWQNILNQVAQDLLQSKTDFPFSVHLISEKAIRKLNRSYRQKDRPATVLSFPIRQLTFTHKTPVKEKQDLGDIFICKEMAEREHQSVDNLIVHGFLHLVGLTHENLRQEKKWDKIEKVILEKLV